MMRRLLAATALFGVMGVGSATLAATPSPFSGETVFGDSLSDGGDLSILEGLPTIQRFTTNPGLTTVEDVAAFYGLSLKPSLQGGTNYAYGGAGVNTNSPGTPSTVPTLTQQVGGYLAANPKLSANELYTVFGGANDIFYNATQVAVGQFVASNSAGLSASQISLLTAIASSTEGVSGPETATQAYTNVTGAAAQEVTLIDNLQKAGAKYIVVFNLPDIGRTPEATAEDKLVPGTAAGLTTLSQGFNTVLNAGLANARTGIVPVNTYALLNEVLANPAAYGFTNDTVPACTTSSSLNCTPSTLVAPNAAATYVFADGVHPTTTTHALFAQVVESELIAPQQVSLLAEAPLAGLQTERDAVTQELLDDQLSSATGVRLFASGGYLSQDFRAQAYTPSMHDDDGLITVGVDARMTPQLTFGGELSGGSDSVDLNGQLRRFRTDSVMGSLFAQYVLGQAYASGQAGFGTVHVGDIQRLFHIGPATRVEQGKVDGQTATLAVTGGYWFGGARLRAGPFVSAVYERVHLDNYAERGDDSTSMTFGSQTREAMIGEVGGRVQASLPTAYALLRPFAEVAYNYDGDARSRDVVAGLTTMNGQFAIAGFSPDRQWGEAQVGVNADIAAHWTAYVAYDGRFAGRTATSNGGDIGVRYSF